MKVFKKVFSIVVLIILVPMLFVNGIILINSYIHPDEIPSFFGWKPFIVLSGSMETEIYAGDIAVVKEVDTSTLKKDDIIAFKADEVVVTHRIVEVITEDGQVKYKTKGDNNNMKDDGYVLPEQVEGVYQFKIRKIGNLAMFIQTPLGMIICISIPLLILVLLQMIESKKQKEKMNDKTNKEKDLQVEIERLKKQNEELKNK